MAAPGTILFTRFNMAPEVILPGAATWAQPIAPIRQFYNVEGAAFVVSAGLNFHEGENRALRTRIARAATPTSEDVDVTFRTLNGIGYDELVWFFTMLNGAAVGVNATADKLWTQTPSMTASNAPVSMTADCGDDIQNWRLQGVMWEHIKLSAARSDLTQLEATGFAQRAVKTAKASPASNAAVKIPGDLWTLRYGSSVANAAAASVATNFLMDWSLDIDTGLRRQHSMDGNLYIGQAVESMDISAVLNMTVQSTAVAVSEFYDKAVAGTEDFIQLMATGAALGATNYISKLVLPVQYEVPGILDGNEDGVNLYSITARLKYDSVSAKSLQLLTTNSIATLV